MLLFNKKQSPIALAMIQPEPLPGSYPHKDKTIREISGLALKEAEMAAHYGFDGFILQNMNDGPIRQTASPESIAYMTVLGNDLKNNFPDMILGILVNWDGVASLCVADAVGADFARVEHLYTGLEIADCGLVEGQCREICDLRKRICTKVPVYADIQEVNRVHIGAKPVDQAARDAVNTAYADGLFMSGHSSNESLEIIKSVRKKVDASVPIFLGGGATGENVRELLGYYDGVSVATWIKDGNMRNPINPERAKQFIDGVRLARDKGI
jgi:membrane complex biogenesis BtpA family protein